MYEIAEYMLNSILEDTMEDAEYITEKEFKYLYKLYSNSNQEILLFLKIIYEFGTCEAYSRLCDYSPNTIKILDTAIDILKSHNIDLVDIEPFEKLKYESMVLIEHLRVIDKKRLKSYLGKIDNEKLHQIDKAIIKAFNINIKNVMKSTEK